MNTMLEEERKKCNRCKVNLLLKDYKLKRDGLYSKNCFKCLDGFTKTRGKRREKNKDKFECKECEYKCSNKSDLQKHNKQVHLKIKDYICEYDNCNMKYSTNGSLQAHINAVHLKIKDFQCDQCDFKCSANGSLQKHIKAVHLKIKDFECEYKECEFTCSTNGSLQQHIKSVHLKIKDFECEQCDYKCSFNGSLQQHIKSVHLKIRDFECSDCDYKFNTNNDLQRHIKAVHLKIKDFECKNCNYKCSDNNNLQVHIKRCTGKEYISSGEFHVRECLREMNIDFQHNTPHIVKDIQMLKWDFILYKDNKVQAFIEYDGKQHFIPVCYGGISKERAEENLRTCQKRDKIKDDFCKENNYPLLRIPYTKFGNIPELVTTFCVEHLDWGDEL